MTAHAITWARGPAGVQLVDEWAIEEGDEHKKIKFYRARGLEQDEEKNRLLCSDLYYLGLVAQKMKEAGKYLSHPMREQVEAVELRILTLLSRNPTDRMKIFDLGPVANPSRNLEPKNSQPTQESERHPPSTPSPHYKPTGRFI